MQIQGIAGPVTNTDGTLTNVRMSHDGSVVVQDGHAPYQEAVYRGNVFALATAAAGVTVAAANVFSSTAPAQPLVGIFNPSGSGKNAVLLYTEHVWASGTAAASGMVLGVLPAATISAAGGNGAINALTLVTGGSTMKTFVNAAITGQSGACSLFRYLGGPTSGALAAGGSATYMTNFAGSLIVPPGAFVGIFAAAAGTSPIVAASMVWEEIAV